MALPMCGGSYSSAARELGFTLDEVRALLKLSESDGETAARSAQMERTLTDAVRRCDAGEVPGCPLIDVLAASA